MARIARTAFLATLLIAAVALAACGGDNTRRNRYITRAHRGAGELPAGGDEARRGADEDHDAAPGPPTLTRYADAIADTIAALRAIDVPSEVVAEHRRLVARVHDLARRHRSASSPAIEQADRSGLRRARRRIAAATVTFNESARQAGIDIDAKLGT